MGRAAGPVRQTQSYLFYSVNKLKLTTIFLQLPSLSLLNIHLKVFIFARYEAQLSSNAVMPASLYQSNFNLERISSTEMDHSSSAVKLAMELANLCAFNNIQDLEGQSCLSDHFNIGNGQTLAQINDELKAKKSQNMTECVPVPSSEHVAEIVGRQGCKIKALRAKTNTYIKTPVRGEEPVFVVTGRKEDVSCAKREILSAAEHFSQIRATRKNNINSTLALGQIVANTPGQTTISVRVPYRVVGLVVGPKGATIKRIQQQTHTYIVTPSRDKEPVFEVTGLPENVEAARKEIEAHIAIRTGSGSDGFGGPANGSSGSNGGPNGFFKSNSHSGMTLANLLDSSNNYGDLSRNVAWSNGTDSHDSGIGHSPPFEGGLGGGSVSGNGSNGIGAHSTGNNSSAPFKNSFLNHASSTNGHDSSNNTLTSGIWGELNKVLGGLDLNGGTGNNGTSSVNNHHNEINKQFLNIGSRSSLDLGTLGRPTTLTPPQEVTSSATSTLSSSNMLQNNTANGIGRQMSLPTDHNTTLPGYNGILSSSSSSNQDTNSETKDEAPTSKEVLAANE